MFFKRCLQPSLPLIDLTETIKVHTSLHAEQLPALRAGFAGCPHNPRWTARKYYAWKQGRAWRKALEQGELVVRETDSCLVTVELPVREDRCAIVPPHHLPLIPALQ